MNQKALTMGLITIVIWGTTFAAIRAGLQGGYEPGHLVLIRYLIASSCFLLYVLWPGSKFKLPLKQDLLKIILLSFSGITIYHAGITFGMEHVTAGTAGMLVGSAPIFTTIIAVIALNERLTKRGWLGLFTGFIGVGAITLGTGGSQFGLSFEVLFIIAAVIAAAIFFVFQKALLLRYSPIEMTAYFTWFGTIPFFVFAPGLTTTLQQASTEAHLAAVFAGIFPAAIAYVTWSYALAAGEASKVSSLLYLVPVIAITVAWIWLNEWPAPLSLTGGIIALLGVFLINTRQKPPVQSKQRQAA
ncbi:drug/metabolite transporter (DMT)-like permease [Salsuginibacillus halophilus]|uniref:Drug/metabolite transporter (DMT)-like permease n=1 Tax=Salsuginibacillus halophilus TaxID=517424 RepID=A0A2P8HG66_9BACI|nr:DMT family transporter [Salsuginibacillus halophilus]PSL45217.1 drug/metabolite transporter (DMT)-like permease [Salsuginibacillus halophilus]